MRNETRSGKIENIRKRSVIFFLKYSSIYFLDSKNAAILKLQVDDLHLAKKIKPTSIIRKSKIWISN